MSIFKTVKNAIRKYLINPLGYDLIPFKNGTFAREVKHFQQAAERKENVHLHIDQYIELFGQEAVQERRFYNLGAEPNFNHPAWTVINHPSVHYGDSYMDLVWDLMSGEPLPIEDGKARVIFSRYTLEHVDDTAVNHFLQEAYRALIRGGYLRLIVPDIDIFYLAYLAKMPDVFYRPKQDLENFPNEKFLQNPNQTSFEQRFLWTFASNASQLHPNGAAERISDEEFREVFKTHGYEDALNYCTAKCSIGIQKKYPENHINWFNANKLLGMIRQAGFETCYRSGYGQSRCPILREVNLLETRQPEIGLFIEAIK